MKLARIEVVTSFFGLFRGLAFGVVVSLVGALPAIAANALLKTEPDLLEAERAFQLRARWQDANTVELQYAIADQYYMYRDRFRFSVNGVPLVLARSKFPAGKMKTDATFGSVVTYRDSVRLLLPLALTSRGTNRSGTEPIKLDVSSQGCADIGVCYPPLKQTLLLARGSSAFVQPEAPTEVIGFSGAKPTTLSDRLKLGK